jgi:hypothetical protein
MARRHSLTRFEQAASVLYPSLASEDTRKDMKQMASADRKRPPSGPVLLSDKDRGATSPLDGRGRK